jgi:simple sugar transport system substrate-binding protein
LKKFLILLVVLVFILAPISLLASDDYEIAVVVKIGGIPWFNRMEVGVKEAAEKLGINAYQIGPSDADPAQQVKIVEDLIAKGVDAICVVPNDATALEPVFEKAKEKGIIIITHESPDQKGANWDVETIDNVIFGEENFKKLAELCGGEGQYALFVGGLTVPLHNFWADTGLAYFEENYPNMELVTTRIPCGESVELSYQRTQELLNAYPDLKGIVGFGSLGPIGAAQALRERGLGDKVAVVGTVLPEQAAPFLSLGLIDWGYLWDPKDAGFAQVYLAKSLLEGIEIDSEYEIPGLGKATIDGNIVKFDAIIDITAENALSYGF